MAKPTFEFTIVVAGPSDTNSERQEVFRAIEAWNTAHSRHMGLRLIGTGWEHVRPSLDAHPQAVINRHFGDRYQALIALIKTRLGSKTEDFDSGTVEEITLAMRSCPNIMVYFYKGGASIPQLDGAQLQQLQQFRKTLQDKGFLGSWTTRQDLRDNLHQHIASLAYTFAEQLSSQSSDNARGTADDRARTAKEANQAILKILSDDNHAGPWIYQLANNGWAGEVKLNVQNIGRAAARDVTAWVTIGNNSPQQGTSIPLLRSLETTRLGFVLRFPEQFPGAPDSPVPADYPHSDLIKLVLRFSDFQHELGEQETEPFCFRFVRVTEGARWRSRVESCEPAPSESKRATAHLLPPGLTPAEHDIMRALVRRVATKSSMFNPVIFSRRAGDDKTEYQSDPISGMEAEITDRNDKTHFYPSRDFLPDLAPAYLLRKESRRTHDLYHMKRSLFEAYGFESPVS